jgi:excisionase family DNA binding protein
MSSNTLSPDDVARQYGVTVPTVLAWIHSGELRALNVSRNAASKKPRWRVTLAALERFEQVRTATPQPQPSRRRRQSVEVIHFYG